VALEDMLLAQDDEGMVDGNDCLYNEDGNTIMWVFLFHMGTWKILRS
jgi:hypothetical protein